MFPREFDPAQPELMDRPQPVSAELETDLANLVGINRHFGSHRLIRRFLRRWFRPGETYRLLDLCTASGDIPRLIADHARANGVTVRIEAVDYQGSTVEIARRLSAGYPEIDFREGDALNVLGGAGEYDFVFCSLALHHFGEDDAVRLLRRARELARRAVLVADLERSRLAAAAVWLLTAVLYREPMTKYDARISVRRAFTCDELAALARRAGWEDFRHRRFPVARQAIWLEGGDGFPPAGTQPSTRR